MEVSFNSYYLYKKYEKRGDQPWIPVYPEVLSFDADGTMPLVLKKSGDTSCSAEPIYRWSESGYTCDNGNKYKNYVKEISYDSGNTWVVKQFVESSASTLIETESYDCGYRTYNSSGSPYCNGCHKYVDVYKVVSVDGGDTWYTASTTPTIYEYGSQDCDSRYCEYLTFIALENGVFSASGSDISYSTNNGETWSSYSGRASVNVSSGDTVLWKGHIYSRRPFFSSTCYFKVRGNINSLVYGDNFSDKIDSNDFRGTFSGCTKIVNAEDLILPATILEERCYENMFSGCTSLVKPPALPATTLSSSCYLEMFAGCESLTTAPELPALYTEDLCYLGMFSGCTSLTTAPALNAMYISYGCYESMFAGCSSLTTAPALRATRMITSCYRYMFIDCVSLTETPSLPARTLEGECYEAMFSGCTSLRTVTDLPATKIDTNCYAYMFAGCTSLATVPSVLPATIMEASCYESMFAGCTSLTTAPELPAIKLAIRCYRDMFIDCTSLATAPELPATELVGETRDDGCYQGMFAGCTSLATVPSVLPATTLSPGCYESMFSGCTSLATAPELPARQYSSYCYYTMFADCTSLSKITCLLSRGTNSESSLSGWVRNVPQTGLFVKHTDSWWPYRGDSGIPIGWTVDVYVS